MGSCRFPYSPLRIKSSIATNACFLWLYSFQKTLSLTLGQISIGARGTQARGLAPMGASSPQHPPLKKEGKRKKGEKRKKK